MEMKKVTKAILRSSGILMSDVKSDIRRTKLNRIRNLILILYYEQTQNMAEAGGKIGKSRHSVRNALRKHKQNKENEEYRRLYERYSVDGWADTLKTNVRKTYIKPDKELDEDVRVQVCKERKSRSMPDPFYCESLQAHPKKVQRVKINYIIPESWCKKHKPELLYDIDNLIQECKSMWNKDTERKINFRKKHGYEATTN